MSIEALERAINFARVKGLSVEISEPVSADRILEVEDKIGYKIPLSYRYFLEKYGTVAISSIEILGVIADRVFDDSHLSFMSISYDLMHECGLPSGLFAIENLDDGYYACLNMRHAVDGDSSVVLWDLGKSEEKIESLEVLSDSFGDYLEKRIHDLIESGLN